MGEKVVYEIARYDGWEDDAELIDRVQLVSLGSALILRDSAGNDALCKGDDVVAVIASTAVLRELRAGQDSRITCVLEIVGQLPFVLEPVIERDETENLWVKVNDEQWSAFRTEDEEFAMLPGLDSDDGPDMSPCWAEFQVGEGESNPLIGWTSIGLAMNGVAVEYARYDHGGFGSESAVKVWPFDDFATVFVDWLLNIEVLGGLWGGDSSPYSPTAELFETAAAAADRKASWRTAAGWTYLKLGLPDPLIDEVRRRLSAVRRQPS